MYGTFYVRRIFMSWGYAIPVLAETHCNNWRDLFLLPYYLRQRARKCQEYKKKNTVVVMPARDTSTAMIPTSK